MMCSMCSATECWQWLSFWCPLCQRLCESSLEKEINQRIDKIILSDKRKSRRELKLLLLGTGESGKSTFIKQMKIIHERDYTLEERVAYVTVIHNNVFTAVHSLLRAMNDLNIDFSSETSLQFCQLFSQSEMNSFDLSEEQFVSAIKHLWSDSGIKVKPYILIQEMISVIVITNL